MTTDTLTPRQRDVACAIRDYRHRHGYPPTIREIGEVLGVSTGTLAEHFDTMEQRGFLTRDRHKARSVTLADGLDLPPLVRQTKLPVLGTIGGGVLRLVGG